MFEKLITDLKKSLPEPLRKKLGAEPVSEDTEETEVNEDPPEETTEENSGPSEADKKKKQKTMIIRVVIVLALGYLAYDHFLAQPPEPSTEELLAAASKPRKRKRPPVKKEVQAKPADAAADVKNTPAASSPEVPADKQPAVVEATPPSAQPEPAMSSSTQPQAQAQAQAPVEEIHIADKKSEEPAVGEVPQHESEVKGAEEHIDKTLDGLIDGMDKKEKKEKKELNLADKIVVDDVYTPPPAYDQLGRGLVYNCVEKYWSCVDKTSYVSCNKNMKWNKAHGKPVECSIVNVYSNDDDCNKVQKYNVSTSQSTAFCQ